MKPPRAGLVLAFLAYASWGLLSPVGKHLLDAGAFRPLALNAVRFLVATPFVLWGIGRAGRRETWRLLCNRDVILFNLLANVSLTLFLYSLPLMPAAYATLGFYTAPLWTGLWAWLRLHERLGPWFGPACVALLGGGYLALFGWARPGAFSWFGLALAVASGFVWALYSVGLRNARALPLKPLLGVSFTVGALYYSALALLFEAPHLGHPDSQAWGWMALYVLVPTLLSFILFNASLQKAPASQVNLLVGAELAFTILFSALLFGARYGAWQIAGVAIVLLSVTGYLWLAARAEARLRRSPPAPPPAMTPPP
ncbi:MAG: DMT family transporter [Thermoplasmatota archaeon]